MSISEYFEALNTILYQTGYSTIEYQLIIYPAFFVLYGIYYKTFSTFKLSKNGN